MFIRCSTMPLPDGPGATGRRCRRCDPGAAPQWYITKNGHEPENDGKAHEGLARPRPSRGGRLQSGSSRPILQDGRSAMADVDYTELQQRYGGQYIARREGEIVASAETYETLSDLVEALPAA